MGQALSAELQRPTFQLVGFRIRLMGTYLLRRHLVLTDKASLAS